MTVFGSSLFFTGNLRNHRSRPRTTPFWSEPTTSKAQCVPSSPDQAVARTSLSAIAGCRRPPDARSQYPSKASSAGVSTSHGNSAGSPGMGTGEMIRSRSRGPSRTTSTGSCPSSSCRTIAPRTRPPSTEKTLPRDCPAVSEFRQEPLDPRRLPAVASSRTRSRRPTAPPAALVEQTCSTVAGNGAILAGA